MKLISIALISFIFLACSVEPVPINYGNDACHFCKMTIVDSQHAAQAVTSKGKIYKYDAGECMVNDLKKKNEIEMAFLLVNDYAKPGELIDAKQATFLISENIKSPMGANLSAFAKSSEANKALKEHGGELFGWQDLNHKIE